MKQMKLLIILKIENELLKRKLLRYQKIFEMLDEEQFDDCN